MVDLPSDTDDPLESQIRREAIDALERGIARLPTPLRMALILKDIVELPVADVARVLRLKPATVKTRVHRARLMLRRTIAQTLRRKDAAPPNHAMQVCLDLLAAKQEALDRATKEEIITPDEYRQVLDADVLRNEVIQVDEFDPETFGAPPGSGVSGTRARHAAQGENGPH